MISILQVNLQRSATAQNLLCQTAAEEGANLLIISEQNWNPVNDDTWVCSDDRSCAVSLTTNSNIAIEASGSGRGFAWIQSRGVRVYSCYTSRNDSEDNFNTFLSDVETSVRSVEPHIQLIVGGDFNAWSQEWGSARNDARGDQLADLAASLNLLVGNVGTTATYRRVNAQSIIDVTFYRIRAPFALRDWRVLEEVESGSDHRYLRYRLDKALEIEGFPERPRGWSYRRLDADALASHLATALLPPIEETTSANEAADLLVTYLESACNACMPPRAAPPDGKRHVHWWNQDIKTLREEHGRMRRQYQRSMRRRNGSPEQTEAMRANYKAKRKELRNAIRSSQAKCWSDLCAAVDSDPWGLPYRVVTKRISRRRPGIEAKGREPEIADHLFPNHPPTDWSQEPRLSDESDHQAADQFTLEELREACLRLPAGKATGPDGIPNEVLLRVSRIVPQVLLNTFNRCLAKTEFPAQWKTARLVLLHKGPGKPIEEPSSYRPLCMLNSTAKLLERLLLTRLNRHLDDTGQRTDNQYGFRHGRSTEDAIERVIRAANGAATGAVQHRDICVVVSLDVRNAFNTAPWRRIDAALRERLVPPPINGMIRSYLENRTLLVGATSTERSVTCGVPQGSVLGPALWNVFYEDLLEIDVPSGVQLVAFADDVAVIGIARTGPAAAELLNPVLDSVANWMRDNGLETAPQKSEAVVLTKKYIYDNPRLIVEGHVIPVKPAIKYLGVELDTRLSFTRHIATASRKATESAKAIGRLMPNVGGPSQAKRALLGSVTNSKLLYASPIWASVGVKTAKNRLAMARAQRATALRTTRAYRTVSADASSVLAEMIPADLLAHERARVRNREEENNDLLPTDIRSAERTITVSSWQARWDRSTKGRWTHRLIPNIQRWLEKPPMSLTFHLSQALSGHGCFRAYLKKMNRAEDSYCGYCVDPNDTVEHTIFVCPRWLDDRARITAVLRRPPTASDVEELLCGPREEEMPECPQTRLRIKKQARINRTIFTEMVESIMTTKEADEREDEAYETRRRTGIAELE